MISPYFSNSFIDGYIDAFDLVNAGPRHLKCLVTFNRIGTKYMSCLRNLQPTQEEVEYAAGFDCGALHLLINGYRPLVEQDDDRYS